MSTHHTALIIGGGPAGSAAAHTLARHGIDTALIDKAVFPRDKLCGGLLTLRSQKIYSRIFAAPWGPVIDFTARGVKFFHRTKLLNEVGHADELYFTRRLDFDHFLLNQAIAQGTRLYPGETVIAMDLAGKTCRLRSGTTFTFDYLIGADGVNSLVGKTLFGKAFDPDRVAFALEMEVDRAQCAASLDDPEIIFGLARWGYGWVFPKKNTLTVGIGGLHTKNPELKKMFHEFLAARFGAIPEGKIKGHHLPFGDYRKVPGRGNVLLCGDAAGLVEPITGEGIAFAMQSGLYAAEAIIEAQDHGGDALPCYQARYQEITRDFDHANRLRYLLFPSVSEHLFLKALPRSKTLPRKHLELMADKLQYGDYFRYLMFKALKALVKRALFIK
ncbi:MAG: geranylgeranyl reductase family protein [Gallionellaceae bacterium]|nr:geranylgeranyl reductase family protein [Gallionellaceae bacterium]